MDHDYSLQHTLLYISLVLSKLREYYQNIFKSDSKNNTVVNYVLNDAYIVI